MINFPPELAVFANHLDAQPGPVRTVFQYCLALLMVEAGKAKLVDKQLGEELPRLPLRPSPATASPFPGQ